MIKILSVIPESDFEPRGWGMSFLYVSKKKNHAKEEKEGDAKKITTAHLCVCVCVCAHMSRY